MRFSAVQFRGNIIISGAIFACFGKNETENAKGKTCWRRGINSNSPSRFFLRIRSEPTD